MKDIPGIPERVLKARTVAESDKNDPKDGAELKVTMMRNNLPSATSSSSVRFRKHEFIC